MDGKDVERAISVLTGRIVQSVQPDDALKLTQAALNLSHVKGFLTAEAKDRAGTKGAGFSSAAKA